MENIHLSSPPCAAVFCFAAGLTFAAAPFAAARTPTYFRDLSGVAGATFDENNGVQQGLTDVALSSGRKFLSWAKVQPTESSSYNDHYIDGWSRLNYQTTYLFVFP